MLFLVNFSQVVFLKLTAMHCGTEYSHLMWQMLEIIHVSHGQFSIDVELCCSSVVWVDFLNVFN